MGRRAIKIINLEGLSINGKQVYSGIYKFQNTHGISLFEMLDFLKQKNYLVSWKDYIEECLFFGKKKQSITIDILTSVVDSRFIPEEEYEEFEFKLQKLKEKIENDTTIPE